ncbi:MAG TPA: LexA family transcriptional regulator [Pyrinomonadaceae bacterium]|jgi:transcriptional regulator with XRE-family HTH domain|nr:LexA family transcriptional regulator [Pyrinomonadaceae bacterium]
MSLGQRIKAARKSADYTLVELSQQIGISNQALSSIERGQKNPSKQTLMNLARVLHNSFGIDWLEKSNEETTQRHEIFFNELNRQSTKDEWQKAFNEFLDFKFGTDSIAIKDFVEGVRVIPLKARIKSGLAVEDLNLEEKILIPARMTRPGRYTFGVIVQDDSLREELVGPGDVLIANDDIAITDGKFAIIELKGKVYLRRLSLKRRSATLLSPGADNEPLKVPLNQLICLGEVTGLLRFIE